jgi:hypothetical protein
VAAADILSATEAIGSTEGGWLDSVHAYSLSDLTRGFLIYILGANASVGAESAPFAPSDTAAVHIVSRMNFVSGSWVDLTNSRYQMKAWGDTGTQGLGQWMQGTTPPTDPQLYCAIVANSSTNSQYSSGGLVLRFNFRHE